MRIRQIGLLGLLPTAAIAQPSYNYAENCRTWPAVHGSFAVGTVEFELTDSLRSAQYAPVPTPVRRIYVRAWYPAAGVAGTSARPYFTAAEATVLPAVVMTLLQRPLDALRDCATLATHGHQGATPAPGRFPVVTFNHGFASYATQNTVLFEHLAANGYVVLTLGHPNETGGIVYPNGDRLPMSPRLLDDLKAQWGLLASNRAAFGRDIGDRLRSAAEYVGASRHSSFGQLPAVWREDGYFVLDRLEAGAVPVAAAALAAAIDHQRRGYVGMSFGGYVAGLSAQGDPRARAGVNLDGGSFTYELIDADVRTPFLTINSDLTYANQRILAAGGMIGAEMYQGSLGPHTPTGKPTPGRRPVRNPFDGPPPP